MIAARSQQRFQLATIAARSQQRLQLATGAARSQQHAARRVAQPIQTRLGENLVQKTSQFGLAAIFWRVACNCFLLHTPREGRCDAEVAEVSEEADVRLR